MRYNLTAISKQCRKLADAGTRPFPFEELMNMSEQFICDTISGKAKSEELTPVAEAVISKFRFDVPVFERKIDRKMLAQSVYNLITRFGILDEDLSNTLKNSLHKEGPVIEDFLVKNYNSLTDKQLIKLCIVYYAQHAYHISARDNGPFVDEAGIEPYIEDLDYPYFSHDLRERYGPYTANQYN